MTFGELTLVGPAKSSQALRVSPIICDFIVVQSGEHSIRSVLNCLHVRLASQRLCHAHPTLPQLDSICMLSTFVGAEMVATDLFWTIGYDNSSLASRNPPEDDAEGSGKLLVFEGR